MLKMVFLRFFQDGGVTTRSGFKNPLRIWEDQSKAYLEENWEDHVSLAA